MSELNLFLYECKNKECNYSFFSSSHEHSLCPNCGEESLNILKEITVNMEKKELELSMKEQIKQFLIECNINLPKVIKLDIQQEWQSDVGYWDYLAGVNIYYHYHNLKDANEDSDAANEIRNKLREYINDNFTIQDMKDSKCIEL